MTFTRKASRCWKPCSSTAPRSEKTSPRTSLRFSVTGAGETARRQDGKTARRQDGKTARRQDGKEDHKPKAVSSRSVGRERLAQPQRKHLRNTIGAHTDSIEGIGNLDRAPVVGNDDD